MRSLIAALALSLVSVTASAEPVAYTFDSSHSLISFEVPHMMVSSVTGRFKEVQKADITLEEQDLTKSKVVIEIKADSINTDHVERDKHLRDRDFFDTAKYKVITFESTKITRAGSDYKVTGNLTIRNVKRSVTLDAKVSAPVKSPWGHIVRSVELTGVIKRTAFGLTYNQALEAGGVVIGDDVTLTIKAEITKPGAAPTPPAAAQPKPPAAPTPPAAQPKPPAAPTPPAAQPKPPAAPTPPAAQPKPPAAPTPPGTPAKPPAAPAKPKP